MYPIWYKEETLGTQVTEESQVTTASDHTLYVKWFELETSFEYTGDIQTYTPSITGIYKLEVWGAGGYSSYGGKGGYSVGYAQLNAGETLYVGVGGTGTSVDGGYNGGGPGNPGEYQTGAGGGGGTHIAKMDGTIASIGPTNLSKILIIAGGGGGGSKYVSGTKNYGGDGGGLEGGKGSGQAGTQCGGYQFGQSGSSGNAQGGGGGLYGAFSKGLNAPGGSSYIGGVTEFTYNGTTYSPSTTLGGGSANSKNGQAKITFVESIETVQVLNETRFVYSESIQTYEVARTGIYKLEVWGAGGYSYGGTGGYSVGYAQLSEGETLYVGVGGTGTSVDGGYNGGGPGNPGEYQTGSGGGGGTHIAKMDGTIASIGPTNLSKILIVAGGGGGGSKYASGTLNYGGNGGGLEGGTGSGQAGTQSGGYQFGQSGSSGNAQGGGGGLYGAFSKGLNAPGGSGYIGGVPEFTYNGTTYSPSTTLGGGSGNGLHGQARITFVESIETVQVLNETRFVYSESIQTYEVARTGIYKLEVWGAGGYSYGGKGGYSVGYAQLSEGETLYVGVGGTGTSVDGGYNGGGPGNPGEHQSGSGGGGGTHIAKMDGTIASIGPTNLSKILIIAGGGGGGSKYESGTLHYGGDGGGLEGGAGSGQAGTQSGGYQFGQSGSSGNAQGGGGGLYGAFSKGLNAPGGSSYIGGVPEFTYNGTTYSPSTTLGGGSGSGLHGQARITFVESIETVQVPIEARFVCSNSIQTYEVTRTGIYKLEVWGAGGYSYGGKGGYSVGYAQLNEGETLYVGVGGTGTSVDGGYNGGGPGNPGEHQSSSGGGGGTHIAKMDGTIASIGPTNLSKILIVAGGGGGGSKYESGTLHYGGDGGGLEGGAGSGQAGTQSEGYQFGQSGSSGNAQGGGGGLYGAFSKGLNAPGGSGYIGGVPEFTYNGTTYSPSTTLGGGSDCALHGQARITFVE